MTQEILDVGGGRSVPQLSIVPAYVNDLCIRIHDGSDVREGYFNFGLVTGAFSDYAVIHYPWRCASDPERRPGQVIVVRRDRTIRVGFYDTLTEAVAALAATAGLPDYEPGATLWETAQSFFEHCVAIGVACPRYNAVATRREREDLRAALTSERETAARLKKGAGGSCG